MWEIHPVLWWKVTGEYGQAGTASLRSAWPHWDKSCLLPSPFSWDPSLQWGEWDSGPWFGVSVKNNHSLAERVGQFMANKHKSWEGFNETFFSKPEVIHFALTPLCGFWKFNFKERMWVCSVCFLSLSFSFFLSELLTSNYFQGNVCECFPVACQLSFFDQSWGRTQSLFTRRNFKLDSL